MLKLILSVTFTMLAFNAFASTDSCVEEQINNFRSEFGEEPPITNYMIEEWEEGCSGNSEEIAPPKVTIEKRGNFLYVQSEEDELTVTKMVVNRGNCEINPHNGVPFTIKYGQVKNIQLFTLCKVLEVEITANGFNGVMKFN